MLEGYRITQSEEKLVDGTVFVSQHNFHSLKEVCFYFWNKWKIYSSFMSDSHIVAVWKIKPKQNEKVIAAFESGIVSEVRSTNTDLSAGL